MSLFNLPKNEIHLSNIKISVPDRKHNAPQYKEKSENVYRNNQYVHCKSHEIHKYTV